MLEGNHSCRISWESSIEQYGIGVKQKRDSTTISMLTNSSYSAQTTTKDPIVSDTCLDPQTGSLSGRLNDNYIHYPEIMNFKQPCCSIYLLQKRYADMFSCAPMQYLPSSPLHLMLQAISYHHIGKAFQVSVCIIVTQSI
jgi:hypothetical protein